MEVFVNASDSSALVVGLSDYFRISFMFYFVVLLIAFYFVGLSFYKR